MQAIVRWCLKNRSVVFLATAILIAGGVYATTRLNQELLPDIEFPIITVSTPVPGAGPDVVDEQVTQPIESAVESIEGIEDIRSTSAQGFSVVVVELGLDVDTEEAEAEINAALDGMELPEGAEEPEVARQSASGFPVMSVSLSAKNGDLTSVTDYARDEAIPLIEDVEGVASADLVGGSERQIEVNLDPERLQEEGVPAEAVVGAISGSAVSAPVGNVRIDGLSTPVRATSGISDAKDLRELPIGPAGAATGATTGAPTGGAPTGAVPSSGGVSAGAQAGGEAPGPVLLEDVAEVREVDADIAGISRTDGEPSLSLNITKEPDANTVEVAEGVEGALEEIRADLGEDEVLVVFNSAEDVEESVSGLVEKAVLGGVLAILVIFFFLRSLRATLVTAVSLPTSILAALLFSWGYDLTLNIITLAGLTIAVGRVVDDAIVVLENSYRYVQKGFAPEEAALRGTSEVANAITSSTLTTVAVFLPLGLVGGIVSKFFLPLSLTVAFALLASLLVAITIIPVLASAFIRHRATRDEAPEGGSPRPGAEGDGDEGGGLLAGLYTPVLAWSLRHRFVVMLLAVLAFVGGLAAIPLLAVSFFPPSEERLLQANVELPAGTAQTETAERLRPFEEYMLDDRGVESYQLSVGGENSFDPNAPLRGENQAQAFIAVRESADVSKTLKRLSEEGRDLYGENFQVQILQQGPPTGGLEVTITGGSQEELRRASEKVAEALEENGDIRNIESDLSEVSPEVKVDLDPQKAARAGLSPAGVSASLGALLNGGQTLSVGETPVSVGVAEGSIGTLDEVRALPVGSGQTVGDVAEVGREEAPSAITRSGGEKAVTVTGTIDSEDTSGVSAEVSERLQRLDLPEGVTAQVGGESEDIAESFRNLILSIAVALALVYLILVVFFGSLLVPLVILLAVPLTTSGAFGALLLTGTPLSLPALLGVLLLIGIVVSNAILLVDFAISAGRRHETVDGAIIEAGRARLRPILMTAFATIFALVPLALGYGNGGSVLISSSLAIPVIGGLLTSTLLTLIVVPVGYSLLAAGRRRKKG